MNPVISPGDRVSVEKMIKGYSRGYYKATVLSWTRRGNIKVKFDGTLIVKVVQADRVKKVANGSSLQPDDPSK
ncbi:hypothetical protein GO755_39700 [Spirosoma sp. HMF4905]|uniref:Uncharacterized protein n=1 Tax=Spirosoma arboris TaxID=2682092 RepID=A0A7K1SQX8_9BACT|nr:hypothetical protein [Spirosoma arboris]MVM36202.1 hypothetical protein [Spirosoma arboris]